MNQTGRDGRNSPPARDVDGKVEDGTNKHGTKMSATTFMAGPSGGRASETTTAAPAPAPAPAPQETRTEPDEELKDLIQKTKSKGLWKDHNQRLLETDGMLPILKGFLVETLEKTLEAEQRKREAEQRILEMEREVAQLKESAAEYTLKAQMNDTRPLFNVTDSLPHVIGLNHAPASIHRVSYDYHDESAKIPEDSHFEKLPTSIINSETDVQSFVYRMLSSIVKGLGLGEKITIFQNRRILGTECDIVLMYGTNYIPFSPVEVKKNGNNDYVKAIFEDDDGVVKELKGKVQGEHFTQLTSIQLFGFTRVFGLITDGNHSMITCTSEFQNEDFAQGVQSPKKRTRSDVECKDKAISPDNAVKFPSSTQVSAPDSNADNRRFIYCSDFSDVIREGRDGVHANWVPTLKMLTHYVHLAFNSVDRHEFTRNVPLETNLPARKINLVGRRERRGELDFTSGIFAHTTIKFDEKPDLYNCLLSDSRVSIIKLFKHLGMGMNGDCCLATTESGSKFCAIKFFAEQKEAVVNATNERNLWNEIYEETELPKALVVTFPAADEDNNTDACMCMPYLVPIDGPGDRTAALEKGDIRVCLEAFAAKNYHHCEVKWRHLGRFRTLIKAGEREEQYKVFLSDLGGNGLKKRGNATTDAEWKESTATWIDQCLKELAGSVGEAENGLEVYLI